MSRDAVYSAKPVPTCYRREPKACPTNKTGDFYGFSAIAMATTPSAPACNRCARRQLCCSARPILRPRPDAAGKSLPQRQCRAANEWQQQRHPWRHRPMVSGARSNTPSVQGKHGITLTAFAGTPHTPARWPLPCADNNPHEPNASRTTGRPAQAIAAAMSAGKIFQKRTQASETAVDNPDERVVSQHDTLNVAGMFSVFPTAGRGVLSSTSRPTRKDVPAFLRLRFVALM